MLFILRIGKSQMKMQNKYYAEETLPVSALTVNKKNWCSAMLGNTSNAV